MQFNLSSRVASFVVAAVSAGFLVACSGCGGSKAASAHTPPPQTLSEPVRVASVNAPAEAPAIPVSARMDDPVPQKAGESRELPTFLDPQRSTPAPVAPPRAPVVTEPSPMGGNNYHTLQKGETLYALSRKYNVKVNKIIEANHFKDPNHLAVGTKVFIPN